MGPRYRDRQGAHGAPLKSPRWFDVRPPRGIAFAASRLAAGASTLRDMIVDAWEDSAGAMVGYSLSTSALS